MEQSQNTVQSEMRKNALALMHLEEDYLLNAINIRTSLIKTVRKRE